MRSHRGEGQCYQLCSATLCYAMLCISLTEPTTPPQSSLSCSLSPFSAQTHKHPDKSTNKQTNKHPTASKSPWYQTSTSYSVHHSHLTSPTAKKKILTRNGRQKTNLAASHFAACSLAPLSRFPAPPLPGRFFSLPRNIYYYYYKRQTLLYIPGLPHFPYLPYLFTY